MTDLWPEMTNIYKGNYKLLPQSILLEQGFWIRKSVTDAQVGTRILSNPEEHRWARS